MVENVVLISLASVSGGLRFVVEKIVFISFASVVVRLAYQSLMISVARPCGLDTGSNYYV